MPGEPPAKKRKGKLRLYYGQFMHPEPKEIAVEIAVEIALEIGDPHVSARKAILAHIKDIYGPHGDEWGTELEEKDCQPSAGKEGGDGDCYELLGIANLAYTLLIAPKFARLLHRALEKNGCLLLSGSYGLGKSFIAENLGRWFVHPKGRGSFKDFVNGERWQWPNAGAAGTSAASKGLYHMVQLHGASDYESFVQRTVADTKAADRPEVAPPRDYYRVLQDTSRAILDQHRIYAQENMANAMWSQPRNRVVDGPLVTSLVNARLLARRHKAEDIKKIEETKSQPDAHQEKRNKLKDSARPNHKATQTPTPDRQGPETVERTRERQGTDTVADERPAPNDKAAPPSVLFVDELSRPEEVAAVTGELLYALENRGKPIPLSYEPSSDFTIPHNFFLIATMNHLDANVSKLDTAIEQRFFQYKLRADGDTFYSPYDAIVRFMRRHAMTNGRTNDISDKLKNFIVTVNKALRHRSVPERLFLGPRFVIKWADMWQKKEDLELLWFTSLWPYLERCVDDASEFGDDINRAFGTDEREKDKLKFIDAIKGAFLDILGAASGARSDALDSFFDTAAAAPAAATPGAAAAVAAPAAATPGAAVGSGGAAVAAPAS